MCTIFLNWFPSRSEPGSKGRTERVRFHTTKAQFTEMDLTPQILSHTICCSPLLVLDSWAHLGPLPHEKYPSFYNRSQGYCLSTIICLSLGREEENVERHVTAPRTPPLPTLIFPKAISQILSLRIPKAIHGYLFPMKSGPPLQTKGLLCKYASCREEHRGLHHFRENFLSEPSQKWHSVPKLLHAKFQAKVILGLSKQARKENTHPQNALTTEIYVQGLTGNSGDA